MKNVLTYISLIFIFILQSTIGKYIDIMHIFPNVILVFIICYGLKTEPLKATCLACIGGLIMDMSLARTVGMNSLLCMYTGLAVSYFGFNYLKDNIITTAFCVLFVSFIYETVYGFLNLVIFGHAPFGTIIVKIVAVEAVYNMAVSFIIYWLADWLSEEQMRSF